MTTPHEQTDQAGSGKDRAEAMRTAMADYVRSVHQAYLSGAAGQPPGIRGRLPLLRDQVTVVAAGARNLHVIATTDPLPPPTGQEVSLEDQVEDLAWTLRFYDPVVLPPLGLVEESGGPAFAEVRRALGLSSVVYHLVVQPGATLDGHQAGHAGAGLAMDHLSDARDYDAVRAKARGAERLVDEMEVAAASGLPHAAGLLAAEVVRRVAPWDTGVAGVREAAAPTEVDQVALRKALLAAVRGTGPR